MRLMIVAALAALALPAAAGAQSMTTSVCKNGEIARVRVSKIKPNGSMAGFNAAVADHVKWYRSHGYKINQRVAPVIIYKDGHAMASPDEVLTYATGDNVPREKQDAGWKAYVAKYRANSDLESEHVVCMPKT